MQSSIIQNSSVLGRSGQIPFIITIDTEGDNLWGKGSDITTNNAKFLPRFFDLCNKYDQKPTMLTNYEMAIDGFYKEFIKDKLTSGLCEIGAHVHAWNSPPMLDSRLDGMEKRSYLVEYDEKGIYQKVDFITKLLEDEFNESITSHRAGRWALNSQYVSVLKGLGYRVDCSVTPGVDWSTHPGETRGGSNYQNFPGYAYYMNEGDISLPAEEGLLQVPMSVRNLEWNNLIKGLRPISSSTVVTRKIFNRLFPAQCWLRPNARNLRHMQKLLKQEKLNKAPYVEFMLHSSELMPGGSPLFQTKEKIDRLYRDLEKLFEYAEQDFYGVTLSEYACIFSDEI